MNIFNIFTKCISIIYVIQINLHFHFNNDPNVITFSTWTIPRVEMAPNLQVKGGIGTVLENYLPGAELNSPFNYQFGTADVFEYNGPGVDSILCTMYNIILKERKACNNPIPSWPDCLIFLHRKNHI